MNFLDTYGITGMGTSTPPTERQPEQSLNEEVSQVIGQLGRFWGGFRKQSEVALATARRDFDQVVTQAQREIGKLTIAETQPNDPSRAEGDGEEESDADDSADTPTEDLTRAASAEPHGEASGSASSTTTAQSFFSRLQSTIPPNIVSTVQAQLPESLRNAQHIDLAQLGSSISTEFQRVQGVTRAQAEEYVHKSEVLIREAMKEAGDVLREAVKVIPPEGGEGSADAPVVWDGADIWMLPGLAANADGSTTGGSKGKGKEVDSRPSSGRPSEDMRRAVATRAESLLKRLRSNPEIIKLDPAVDTSKAAYMAWVDASEASGQGFGTKAWGERIVSALSDPSDGATLQATLDALVPSSMPEEVFWVRYFFRVHQIEAEENRRKALLRVSAENEDEFSWEDDEEESDDTKGTHPLESSQHPLAPPRTTSTLDVLSLPSSHAQSPRESSESSYDVVSENVGGVEAEEEDEDEDEEDEDEDEEDEDEDEEDEDEDDSDWE